jgi:hypothetical protein
MEKVGLAQMDKVNVGFVNFSSLSDDEVQRGIDVLQSQVDNDFGPVWNVDADLTLIPREKADGDPDEYRDNWAVVLIDSAEGISNTYDPKVNPDEQEGEPGTRGNQLGYHDLTSWGKPLAKVFVGTDPKQRESWVHTASHELLEMLADPDISALVLAHPNATTLRFYAREVCDPVDPLGYDVDGITVSDFVYPAWFASTLQRPPPAGPFHQAAVGGVDAPLALTRGGYIAFFDGSSAAWKLLRKLADGTETVTDIDDEDPRHDRRATPRNHWATSAWDWSP